MNRVEAALRSATPEQQAQFFIKADRTHALLTQTPEGERPTPEAVTAALDLMNFMEALVGEQEADQCTAS